MTAHRHINQAGVDLIKRFEGLRLVAYLDAVGVPTIGYGHTSTVSRADVARGRRISATEAEHLLRIDLGTAEAGIAEAAKVVIHENQFGALVSWAFNVGVAAAGASTLIARLNAGHYAEVPGQLARWTRAGGRVLEGLVTRRQAEAALWATPVGWARGLAPSVGAPTPAHVARQVTEHDEERV